MEAIRIKRKVKSSTLKIKELEKFKDRDVLISITPILPESISSEKEVTKEQLKEELLTISVWDIIEEDLKNVVIKNKDKSKK
ncbi:MAG: hypothetical protein KKD86_01530 [Bacteroidetes bacterium]|nr:hypothetical protein [Bacteroidota bacterium]MBU1677529.1 hypothetical protein [Bacteroidota bacterium]